MKKPTLKQLRELAKGAGAEFDSYKGGDIENERRIYLSHATLLTSHDWPDCESNRVECAVMLHGLIALREREVIADAD